MALLSADVAPRKGRVSRNHIMEMVNVQKN